MTQKHRELTNSELTQSLRGSFGMNLDSLAAEPVPLTSSSDKCWLLMLICVLSYLNLIIALKSGYYKPLLLKGALRLGEVRCLDSSLSVHGKMGEIAIDPDFMDCLSNEAEYANHPKCYSLELGQICTLGLWTRVLRTCYLVALHRKAGTWRTHSYPMLTLGLVWAGSKSPDPGAHATPMGSEPLRWGLEICVWEASKVILMCSQFGNHSPSRGKLRSLSGFPH